MSLNKLYNLLILLKLYLSVIILWLKYLMIKLLSRQLKVFMCVPEIVEKVRHDVGKIINHNVSRRIECKFSDVMADYKEQAENRLAEVLNPVVIQKVELFKEEADKAILKVKNHADRAREHANRAGNLVVKINKMEKRVDNIESDMSNSYIQTQINDIKKDMEEMKDMVSKIAKMLNIRC